MAGSNPGLIGGLRIPNDLGVFAPHTFMRF